MIKWKKPSGVEIETNDNGATVAYCESLGWEKVGKSASESGGDKKPSDMSVAELKDAFAKIGENYPGNKEAAIARLVEISADSE